VFAVRFMQSESKCRMSLKVRVKNEKIIPCFVNSLPCWERLVSKMVLHA
jgi:hypothetical protein